MPRQRIIIITILSLCLGGFVAVMMALGMRIFFVTTPSMATAAPVGSLVVTQPASSYHPGDIIPFPAPRPDVYPSNPVHHQPAYPHQGRPQPRG